MTRIFGNGLIFRSSSKIMINLSGNTHRGHIRDNNEDFAVIEKGCAVVCDGVGGHPHGEVASKLAANAAAMVLANRPIGIAAMKEAINTAHSFLIDQQKADSKLRGMATTFVGLMLSEGKAVIGNCGDSRCYLLRDHMFVQLTTDHQSPDGYLLQAVGMFLNVNFDAFERIVRKGDIFVLCTDGLTNAISDDDIRSIVINAKKEPTQKISKKLVDAALAAGGPDNVTVVVAKAT